MYLLTRDFDNKPLLPPPLVIFEDIFLIAKMACKKAMNKSKKNRKKKKISPHWPLILTSDVLAAFAEVSWESINLFEKSCAMAWTMDKIKTKEAENNDVVLSALKETEEKNERLANELRLELKEMRELMKNSPLFDE